MNIQNISPVLSIIVPVYNVEKYIDKAIKSLISQTLIDIEIIIVDDGSTDSSREIIADYAKKDKRIKAFYKDNSGVSSTRNYALKYATGKYVTFMDPDDWLELDFYENMISVMEDNEWDIGISSFYINYPDGSEVANNKYEAKVFSSKDAIAEIFQGCRYGGHLCNKIYLRNFVTDVYLNENVRYCEDLLYNWYVFQKVNTIGYVPLAGYHYFQRENSAWRNIENRFDFDIVVDEIEKTIFYKTEPIYQSWKYIKILFYIGIVWDIIKSDQIDKFENYIYNRKNKLKINLKGFFNKYLSCKQRVLFIMIMYTPMLGLRLYSIIIKLLRRKIKI